MLTRTMRRRALPQGTTEVAKSMVTGRLGSRAPGNATAIGFVPSSRCRTHPRGGGGGGGGLSTRAELD
jgi:hypothetical protein